MSINESGAEGTIQELSLGYELAAEYAQGSRESFHLFQSCAVGIVEETELTIRRYSGAGPSREPCVSSRL